MISLRKEERKSFLTPRKKDFLGASMGGHELLLGGIAIEESYYVDATQEARGRGKIPLKGEKRLLHNTRRGRYLRRKERGGLPNLAGGKRGPTDRQEVLRQKKNTLLFRKEREALPIGSEGSGRKKKRKETTSSHTEEEEATPSSTGNKKKAEEGVASQFDFYREGKKETSLTSLRHEKGVSKRGKRGIVIWEGCLRITGREI